MAIRSLGLVATFALSAHSFLLPPDLAVDSNAPDNDLSTWTLVDPRTTALLVPCEGCKTASSEENNLFINISVGSQPGTLEWGGRKFYPPSALIQATTENPSVLQVPQEVTLRDIRNDVSSYTDNEASVSSWGFSTSRSQTTENGDEMLNMRLEIRMISTQRVNVPAIDLQVLKRPDGEMFIVTSTVNKLVPHPHGSVEEDCDDIFCRLRHALEDKLHGISASMPKLGKHFGKPCHKGKGKGMMKGHKNGPFTNMHHGPNSHHHRPIGEQGGRHGHYHAHHHAHNKLHRFLHRFGRFFMAVAAPILIGIAAGVATYAVGMVLGAIVALVWVKFFRGGRRGYASVAVDEESDDDASVKGLDDDVEARQSYESAPPVYEEGEEVPAYAEKETSA